MDLEMLINTLKGYNPGTEAKVGFCNPHSHRGCYDELAFEPCEETTVGEMLAAAESAVGNTYTGWKGGEFTMDSSTECHIATIGRSGSPITLVVIKALLCEQLTVEDFE